MSSLRGVVGMVTLTISMGLGYVSFIAFTPNEDRKNEIMKNLPESNPMRREETRKRNALVMAALKEAAETEENLVRR